MQIGDILVSSYGYNCSLVSFYKVVRVTKASVYLQELRYKFTEHDGYGQAGKVIPSNEESSSEPFMRRVGRHNYNNQEFVAISKYEYAYAWDGNPVHYDSYD